MNVLMISSSAPPKSGPEDIQVGRYLKELDKSNTITLVTTPILTKSWVKADQSLNVELSNTQRLELKLPFHVLTLRILMSKYLKFFSYPDGEFWIQYKAKEVSRRLVTKPQVIYSRSFPLSAALLAKRLKERLDIPWVMHLSDPWADSPYHATNRKMQKDELACFERADAIMLTTKSMAEFYRHKYSQFAQKIYVSPNVMPDDLQKRPQCPNPSKKLTLLYAGALYGARRLTTILKAVEWMELYMPKYLESFEIEVVGNMTEEIKKEIDHFGYKQVRMLGRVEYAEVIRKQSCADILISIEPDGSNPLLKTFMPSKVLDYMAGRKPILAITPEGSEAWKLCEKGFGWGIKPDDYETLGTLLVHLIEKHVQGKALLTVSEPLKEYSAVDAVAKLVKIMKNLNEKNKIY